MGVTGDELRDLRKRLGLTQVELAEKVGVASNTVARWERGELGISEPVSRLVKLLAKVESPQTPKNRRRPR
jgi:transcriptional regulator with XRE-family HTH domain